MIEGGVKQIIKDLISKPFWLPLCRSCSFSASSGGLFLYSSKYIKFTCAILSISSISRLTIAYMWSNGVGAVCILVTRMVSFTLVNVYKLTDRKERIKIMHAYRMIRVCYNTQPPCGICQWMLRIHQYLS